MIVFLILLLLTFMFSFFTRKSFGKNLGITLMIIPLILYLSQFIFHTFNVGMILILILSGLGLILTIYKFIKKDKTFFNNIFSLGFWTFILIMILIYFTDYQQQFSVWDELAHWGEMVKEMLRLDKFYAVPESLMVWHKDYPPFISLFEFFWCRILGYSEQIMNISLHTYMFALIVPYLVDKIKIKINILVLPILILGVILMVDPYQIFKTIQTDLLISVMTVYSLFLIIFEDKSIFKNICLSLSLLAILLTKQIGIPLALMVFVLYILYEIIIKNQKIKDFKFWLSTFLIIFIPIFLYIIWGVYTSLMKTGAQFALGNINITEYLNLIFKSQGVGYKLEAINLFKKYLITEPIIIKPFKIGYVYCYFLVICLLIGLYFTNKNKFTLKKLLLFLFIFTCGTIGYAFTMSVLYMFCFSEGETVTLACFGRYMSSYVLIELLFILGLYCYLIKDKKFYSVKTILLGIIILLSVNCNLKCLLPQAYFDDNYVEFKEIANIINSNTPENSKIFIVMQDYSYSYLLPYFLGSRPIEREYNYLYDNVNTYEKDKVKDVIFTHDYFYLNDVNEDFIKIYKNIFADEIKCKSLYKIEKEKKKLILVS